MIQRREELRFTLEPRQSIGVGGKGVREHLDRDVAIQPGVAGSVDLAHPTLADRTTDLVRTKPRGGYERHD